MAATAKMAAAAILKIPKIAISMQRNDRFWYSDASGPPDTNSQ